MNQEQFIKDYEAALASQNWDNVEPLIHELACVTFSNGSVHKGIYAIKEAYKRNFAIIEDEEYSIADVHWILKKEAIAVYLFSFYWSGKINGQQASGSGRGTTVIMFENGRWKLIAEHLGMAK